MKNEVFLLKDVLKEYWQPEDVIEVSFTNDNLVLNLSQTSDFIRYSDYEISYFDIKNKVLVAVCLIGYTALMDSITFTDTLK